MFGTIKVGKNTTAHKDFLTDKGYKVAIEGDLLVVDAPGGFVDAINLGDTQETAIAALKGVVEKKALLSYSTRVTFPDGKVLFGVPACTRLGKASALVASPAKAKKAKPAGEFNF